MKKLLVLAFGAFVAQTTEYLPIGLLPQISSDLHVSASAVGALVTSYAWIAALSAIPLTRLTAPINRRTLFGGLLVAISASNVCAAISHSYTWLAVSRVLTASTHGVFWSMLAVFATQLAPKMSASRATAWVYSGISLAVVFGVPSAAAIGQHAGWRTAFAIFAFLGLVVIVLVALVLPDVPAQPQSRMKEPLQPRQSFYLAVFVTGLIITAHFCSYTYIVPLLNHVARIREERLPLLLLIFGIAGAMGTVIVGVLNRRPGTIAILTSIGIVLSQAVTLLSGRSPLIPYLDVALWGVSISALIVSLQSWILELSPQQKEWASSVYVGTFNFGIGAGAFLGGAALRLAGLHAVLWTSAFVGTMATASFAFQSSWTADGCADKGAECV